MAIQTQLRFIGTGKPLRVNVNPRLDREASRKGIRFSGIKTKREFNEVNKRSQPSVEELGRNAVKIPRSLGIDLSA